MDLGEGEERERGEREIDRQTPVPNTTTTALLKLPDFLQLVLKIRNDNSIIFN